MGGTAHLRAWSHGGAAKTTRSIKTTRRVTDPPGTASSAIERSGVEDAALTGRKQSRIGILYHFNAPDMPVHSFCGRIVDIFGRSSHVDVGSISVVLVANAADRSSIWTGCRLAAR